MSVILDCEQTVMCNNSAQGSKALWVSVSKSGPKDGKAFSI